MEGHPNQCPNCIIQALDGCRSKTEEENLCRRREVRPVATTVPPKFPSDAETELTRIKAAYPDCPNNVKGKIQALAPIAPIGRVGI